MAIATAQAKAGDHASARRSFERAIQAADAVEDLSSRAAILADVAEAQVEYDDRTAALATLRDASEVVEKIADEHRSNRSCAALARTLAHAGDLGAALRMVGGVPDGQYLPESQALAGVLEGLRRSGGAALKDATHVLELGVAANNEEIVTFNACGNSPGRSTITARSMEKRRDHRRLREATGEIGPGDVRMQNRQDDLENAMKDLGRSQTKFGSIEVCYEKNQR